MNDILLQKILDLLRNGLAHVGDFFKDLFITDPTDGQVIAYDAESGHWINQDASEVELDLTKTFEDQAIATLPDSASNVPMKSLSVNIVPKETGTGTKSPSNPYTISGSDKVVITHTGKNLWFLDTNSIGLNYNGSANAKRYNQTIKMPQGTYTFSRSSNADDFSELFVGVAKRAIGAGFDISADSSRKNLKTSNVQTVTIDETYPYLFVNAIATADNMTESVMNGVQLQAEIGTTATTYEPYSATTHTIALGQTVYGGYIDTSTGKLVVTHTLDDMGDYNYNYNSTYKFFYRNFVNYSGLDAVKCSGYSYGGYRSDANMETAENYTCYRASSSDKQLKFKNTDYTTPEAFKTAMAGIKIVYELATPITLSITPTAIKTTGYDNVSADCGDVSGEYYTAAADSVIALANLTEDITSEVTKNTTDFSDILLKVSQNNKVVSVEIYSATTAAAVNDTFLSNLPKPAMNCKVLLVNTTLGEDGTILGTLKTSGELEIATSGAKSFSGLITYVAK